MFDDLIPQQSAPAQAGGGMFDDLIPKAAPPAATSQQKRAPSVPGQVSMSDLVTGNYTTEQPQGAISRGVQQTATGFNEGFGKTVLRAADAVPYFASRLAGKSEEDAYHPFEGTFRKLFVDPTPAPANNAEAALRAGGDMAGENVTNIVPGMTLAKSGIRSGVTMAEQALPIFSQGIKKAPGIIADKVRGAADSVLDWMARKPVAATVSDTSGAFQSGAGGETARTMSKDAGYGEDAQKAFQMAGQLGTPAVTSAYSKIAPTALVAKGAAKVAEKGLGMVPDAGTGERIAERLAYGNREGKYAGSSTPEPPPIPREAPSFGEPQDYLAGTKSKLGASTPGAPADPNFVQRIVDKGAAERQTKAADTVQGQFDQITGRPDAAENAGVADMLKKRIPGFQPGVAKETADPALLNLQGRLEGEATGNTLREAQTRVDNSRQSIRDFADKAVPKTETNTPQDALPPAAARQVESETAPYQAGVDVRRQEIQRRSDSLPQVDRIEGGEVMRTSREAAQRAMDAETSRLRSQIANPEAPLKVGDETTTVNAALNRRAQINNDIRDIMDSPGRTPADTARAREMNAERDRIDQAINNVNAPGMAEYTNHYREQNVPQFRQGASAEVGRRDQYGYAGNRVDPEKVGGKFFNPNEESAARQFNTAMGHDPKAKQQMIDNALDNIRHSAIDPATGMLKEGAVGKWLQKNERVLNEVPFVRDAVNAKNPDALYKQIGELEQRQRAAAQSKLASISGKNPEQAVDAALNDWQVMRDMKRAAAADPSTDAALTRAVWDRAIGSGGKDILFDANAMQKWMDGHQRSLNEVLTPKHQSDLKAVIKAAQIEGQLPRPVGTAEMPKSVLAKAGSAIGTPIKSLLQRFLAVAQGRVGKPYTAMDIGTRMVDSWTERETDAIWREALFNPKVAEQLANVVRNKGATGIQLNRMHNYLLTVGAADTGQDFPHQK